MRVLFEIVLAFNLFVLCINVGFYFIGNGLGIDSVSNMSLDVETINSELNSTSQDFGTQGGFNPELIFGDFGRAITLFMQIISGGYILETLTNVGLSQDLIIPMQMVIGFSTVISLLYLLSGRA